MPKEMERWKVPLGYELVVDAHSPSEAITKAESALREKLSGGFPNAVEICVTEFGARRVDDDA